MDVSDQHGEDDMALEPADAMVGAAVQAVVFQGVDRGLYRGVLTAQANKLEP